MENILIVDDIAMNRRLMRSILLRSVQNIDIIEAEDGFIAMELIRSKDISVIILDIMMPGKDGLEVLTELKASPLYSSIPVIICSAVHEVESVEKALLLGALDYFTKPLTEEQIRITLPLKVKNALEYYNQKKQLIQFYEHVKDEMRLAEQLQKSMISEHSIYSGAEMWGRYIPCQEIGGDFFYCKEEKGKLWFMIADVSGHGIAAAMVSTMLGVVFNSNISQCRHPNAMLSTLNNILCEVFGNSSYALVSAFVGCIHEHTLEYSNAGHPYPMLYQRSTERVEELKMNGLLLGILENTIFEMNEIEINAGDAIVLYTDGVFDKGKEKDFVNWNLVHNFCQLHSKKFEDIPVFLEEMSNYFERRNNCSFVDDAAIMILKKN